jgi:hypothetical protein
MLWGFSASRTALTQRKKRKKKKALSEGTE